LLFLSEETLNNENEGFAVQSVWSDLCGTPYVKETEWIGVIAKKVNPK